MFGSGGGSSRARVSLGNVPEGYNVKVYAHGRAYIATDERLTLEDQGHTKATLASIRGTNALTTLSVSRVFTNLGGGNVDLVFYRRRSDNSSANFNSSSSNRFVLAAIVVPSAFT